jgi:hypothetical protein
VARAAEVDPHVRLRAIEGDAWRTLRLAELARRDVLLCAVDNFEARMRMSQLCMLAGVDMVNAGIDSRHASVEVFRFSRPGLCACFECHLPDSAYRKVAQRYSCGWLRRAMLAEDRIATTALTASVAGALAVQAALRIGGGEVPTSQRVLVDTRNGASTAVTLSPNPECTGCAPLWPRPRRVPANGDWKAALAAHAGDAEAVILSDALIFDYACAACGTVAHAARHIGRRADEFDDRVMRCESCGQLAVRVDIRAEVGVDELRERFGGSPLPLKYLLAKVGEPDAVCIDLEDTP